MKFKELRKLRFGKQKDFAAHIGEKQSTVAMWETGKSRPDIDTCYKISDALGVELKEVTDCFR